MTQVQTLGEDREFTQPSSPALSRRRHVLDLDDRDLLQRATAETQQHNHGPDPTRAHHQKCTSKPKVGRIGNMETPERVAGERSYS